jgi:hypothetical protein
MSAPLHIVVIGDSHTAFLVGAEEVLPSYPAGPFRHGAFEAYHVGPGLAASLVERESENNTRVKAMDILARHTPARTLAVMLCFGEIDCRFHILRRLGVANATDAARLQRSIEVTAHRYLSFLLEVALAGFRPLVFAPPATTPVRYDEPFPWPTLGSTAQRNGITRDFDMTLRSLCELSGIGYVSIFNQLVDARLETIAELYFDGVHLGQSAWPIFAKAFREAVPDLAPAIDSDLRAARTFSTRS